VYPAREATRFCWPQFARFHFSRFQATRQRAEQKRARSRLGSNSLPQRSHRLVSATWSCHASLRLTDRDKFPLSLSGAPHITDDLPSSSPECSQIITSRSASVSPLIRFARYINSYPVSQIKTLSSQRTGPDGCA
jgi:hypothetical protein